MATLALNLTEVRQNIGAFLSISRNPSSWDADTTTDIDNIIRAGKRQFFNPPPLVEGQHAHKWSFLEQYTPIVTTAPFNDGTIEIVSGVVTLTGGTWPASPQPENSFLEVEGALYEVASRDSGTQLTLINTGVNAAAGTDYNLYQYRYKLPDNFGGFVEPITRERVQDFHQAELVGVVEYEIRIKWVRFFQANQPREYAVVPLTQDVSGTPNASGVADWYVMFWPLPDQIYNLKGRYRIAPTDGLESGELSQINADPIHAECLLASIMAAAELYHNDVKGPRHQEFFEKLSASVSHDRQTTGLRRARDARQDERRINIHLLTAPIQYSVTP